MGTFLQLASSQVRGTIEGGCGELATVHQGHQGTHQGLASMPTATMVEGGSIDVVNRVGLCHAQEKHNHTNPQCYGGSNHPS